MKNLEFFGFVALGVALLFGLTYGFVWLVGWMQSPENNRGYCMEIAYKTVYIPDAGWSDYDLKYNEKQLPYCVEWENYKP